MTHEAKCVIHDILIATQKRLSGTTGPFDILGKLLYAYFLEWGWT